jgi:hypothetical protein
MLYLPTRDQLFIHQKRKEYDKKKKNKNKNSSNLIAKKKTPAFREFLS